MAFSEAKEVAKKKEKVVEPAPAKKKKPEAGVRDALRRIDGCCSGPT